MSEEMDELHVVIGTGPLGMAVMEELLFQGKKVRMVNRSGHANVPSSVQVAKGDATSSVEFAAACRGASVIYHCAKAPYTAWPEMFPPIMDGIIEAAENEKAIVVYADNLYMYGVTRRDLTEDLPNRADGRKGITRAQMANRLLTAHRSGKLRAAIGRAPDFFGPGVLDSALGERVFRAALEGKPAEVLGNIDAPHTYIYIRDFAKGLVKLGQSQASLGHIWHIPASETLTTRQMVSMVYSMAGREPRFRVAPKAFVSLLSLFNANMREIKEMLYLFEEPLVVNTSKYEKMFGKDTTPHEQAVAETMAWYQSLSDQQKIS